MIPSTTLSPITMSSTTSNNHNTSHRQSSASIRSSKKSQSVKDIVLHHPVASLPPEDWILFPEEVIITKHSSVRQVRSRKVKPVMHAEKPIRSMPTLDKTQPRLKKKSPAYTDPTWRKILATEPEQPVATADSIDEAIWNDARKPPNSRLPQRLPTPDLSDVDEDGFWSCCGSSEGSR